MNMRNGEKLPDTPYRNKIHFAFKEINKVAPDEAEALAELMLDERFDSTEIMHGITDVMWELGYKDFTLTPRAVNALRVAIAFNPNRLKELKES